MYQALTYVGTQAGARQVESLASQNLKISIHMKISDVPNRKAKIFYQIFVVFFPHRQQRHLEEHFYQ